MMAGEDEASLFVSLSQGEGAFGEELQKEREEVERLLAVAVRTATCRTTHATCGDKAGRFVGGHAPTPQGQSHAYQVVCCCEDCQQKPLLYRNSGGRVMSVEQFCIHASMGPNWQTQVAIHSANKATGVPDTTLLGDWLFQQSRAQVPARQQSKKKTWVYWVGEAKWHQISIETFDEATGLCEVSYPGTKTTETISLAAELTADRPRPHKPDIKVDMLLRVPVPQSAEPPPAVLAPAPAPACLASTSNATPECEDVDCLVSLPGPELVGNGSGKEDYVALDISTEGVLPLCALTSQDIDKGSRASSASSNEGSRNSDGNVPALWKSNLTSFVEQGGDSSGSAIKRAKWQILAVSLILAVLFIGGASWRLASKHAAVAEQLKEEQESHLLQFQSLMMSRLASKAKSVYQLSLSSPAFFSDGPERAAAWALMDSAIDQLRQINASGWETLRLDASTTPDGNLIYQATDELQDKSNREYTQTVLQMPPNSVYISQVDLNVEYGEVEVPYLPVYRMACPQFQEGNRTGFVITNLQARHLWEAWEGVLRTEYAAEWDILDSNLYYIASCCNENTEGQLYGMSLPERSNMTYSGPLMAEAKEGVVNGPDIMTQITEGYVASFAILHFKALMPFLSGMEVEAASEGLVVMLRTPTSEVWRITALSFTGFAVAMAAGYAATCALAACALVFWHSTVIRQEQNEQSHEFLASVSHDLRSPLHVMSNALQLLHTDEMATKYEFRALQAAVESMLSLLSNTVYVYRDGADSHVPPQKRNLREDLVSLMEVSSFLANERDLYLDLEVDGTMPNTILINWNGLKQVLVNLLSNSVKFTVEGGILVKATVVSASQDTVNLSISVSDTGPGITASPKALPDIGTTAGGKKQKKSLGLGIGICEKIVASMGASLEVFSIPGQGATFSVTGLECPVVEPPTRPYIFRRLCARVRRAGGLNFVVILDKEDRQNALPRVKTLARLLSRQSKLHIPLTVLYTEYLTGHVPTFEPKSVVWVGYQTFAAPELLPEVVDACQASGSQAVILSYVCGSSCLTEVSSELPGSISSSFAYPPWTPERLASSLLKGMPRREESLLRVTGEDLNGAEVEEDFSNLRVLVVDDMSVNRTIARRIFAKSFGIKLEDASGGKECLEKVKAASPRGYDLILMDLQMPEMNGFECVQAIRSFEASTKATPCTVLCLSASVMASDRAECLKAGMDDFFCKPMSVDQFAKVLASVSYQKALNNGISTVSSSASFKIRSVRRQATFSNSIESLSGESSLTKEAH